MAVLIACFEPSDGTYEIAALPIDAFEEGGRSAARVSTVTAMEIFVRPLRIAPNGAEHVHDVLCARRILRCGRSTYTPLEKLPRIVLFSISKRRIPW